MEVMNLEHRPAQMGHSTAETLAMLQRFGLRQESMMASVIVVMVAMNMNQEPLAQTLARS